MPIQKGRSAIEEEIKKAAKVKLAEFGIELLDHMVIGDSRWVSLKERGLM